MAAAYEGQKACVKALLRAKANTDLADNNGATALLFAEMKGHTAIAELIRQHVASLPPTRGLGVALCAVMRLAWPWMLVFSVVLGAIATVAFSQVTAGPDQHRAVRQRRPHRPWYAKAKAWYAKVKAWYAKANGRTSTAEPTRQHAALLQLAAAVAPHAVQATQAARADVAMEELLAAEAAEQAKRQAPSKRSMKKSKAGSTAAAGEEPKEAPPAAAPAPPPAAAPKPAVSAAARAEAALRTAIAGGGLSALEAALALATHEVREGGVGAEARARCDRLLEAQQEAEREARQEAAAEAASLAAAEQVRGVATREAERAAAASKAREVAAAAAIAVAVAVEAAAAAEAEVTALERAMAGGGEGGGSGAAGPSEASEVVVPDQYICSITAEIMTDPVNTVRLVLCPR